MYGPGFCVVTDLCNTRSQGRQQDGGRQFNIYFVKVNLHLNVDSTGSEFTRDLLPQMSEATIKL